jgi:hypothetical protein
MGFPNDSAAGPSGIRFALMGDRRGPATQRCCSRRVQRPPRSATRHHVWTRARQAALAELTMLVKFSPNDRGNPPGKLADAELHFADGPLEGLKLIGFGIWERRNGNGRNVTFPARQYSVNGERRSFALLRPVVDAASQERLREFILHAYTEYEEQLATAE